MFLSNLLHEEKQAFIELASHVAGIDGIVNKSEQVVLEMFKREMEIEDYQIKNLPIDEILSKFESKKSKNIALIELIGLVFADEDGYDEAERNAIKLIKQNFGLSFEKYEEYKSWVLQFNELYNKGLQLIND